MKFILAMLTLTLASCGGSYWERQENEKNAEVQRLGEEANQRNSNPNQFAYRDGSIQGCESGKADAGDWGHKFQKDVDRYINNQYYKTGFDDGYGKCKSESDNLKKAITDSLNRGW